MQMLSADECPDSLRNLYTTTSILIAMHASLIRRQLGGLIPPKIATPRLVVSSCDIDLVNIALNVTFWLFFLFSSPPRFSLYLFHILGTSVWRIRCRSRASRRLLFEAAQRPSGSSCQWNKGTFLQWCKCIRCTYCCRYSEHIRNQLHSGLQQYVSVLRFLLGSLCRIWTYCRPLLAVHLSE